MAINIFEGARRIALLLGGGAAVITVLVAFNHDPTSTAMAYSLAAPNAPFRRTDGGCPSEGKTIRFNHKTSSGKEIRVWVCLEPKTFTNGERMSPKIKELVALAIEAEAMGDRETASSARRYAELEAKAGGQANPTTELIPYKTDADGMTWGAKPYSSEIDTYETQVKKRFTMPATDEAVSIKEAAKKWRSHFAEAVGYLAAGLAIFGALTWAVGWIVRGFMGIPRGSDQKPQG